jgi:hypothetical protein
LSKSIELAQRRIREDQARLEEQLAVVALLKAQGRPSEAAEMLVRAYQKFLNQSQNDLAVALSNDSGCEDDLNRT